MNRRKLREHLFKMVFVYAFTLEKDMPEQLEMYLDGIEGLSEEDREELARSGFTQHEFDENEELVAVEDEEEEDFDYDPYDNVDDAFDDDDFFGSEDDMMD